MANLTKFSEEETKRIIYLYEVEKNTVLDIAHLYNCCHGKIKLLLEKNNVKFRTHKENQKIVMNRPEVLENVSKASKGSMDKRMKTNIERYGSAVASNNPEIKEKWKNEHLGEFGVLWPNQRQEVRDKSKETCLERYSVDNASKTKKTKEKISKNRWKNKTQEELDEIFEKVKNTWVENLGVDNPLKSPEIVKKMRLTCEEKYGVNWPTKNEETLLKIRESHKKRSIEKMLKNLPILNLELISEFIDVTSKVKIKCLKCETIFESVLDYVYHNYGLCPKCFPINSSTPEKEIKDFILSLFPEEELLFNNRKILEGKELDVVIVPMKIAIELNGLYYHSEKLGVDWKYHLQKTESCLEKGYRLIHIFEDEWIFKKEIVKGRLKNILNKFDGENIHARKCIIKEISYQEKEEFLKNFHIQGSSVSQINLGAFNEDKLISLMTFSKGSISKGSKNEDDIWELNRFCTNYNYHISGIASKLLTHFKNNYNWIEIFSYADRRWSNGDLYYNLGFELSHITRPNYWYVKNMNRIHRFSLRKNENDPKDISEWILRLSEGYYRIWDCGNLKFILKK